MYCDACHSTGGIGTFVMKKRILIFGALLTVGAVSQAQSISSFNSAEISGITTTLSSGNLAVSVGAAPTITWNSVTYNITDVFGVWALDFNDDMTGTGTNQNGWNFDTNFSGTGGIAGWKTNPNSGMTPNQNLSFVYSSLTGSVENVGYHLRISGQFPGGGNTAYFYHEPVPEPASIAALSAGLLALIRKKRAR